MKKNILTALLSLASAVVFAQSTTNYWVVFKDKKNSNYSLSHPEAFLSERSIARREHQHIAYSDKDLPVNESYLKAILATGAKVKNKSKWFNAATVVLTDDRQLNEIQSLACIKSIKKIEIKTSAHSADKFNYEKNLSIAPTADAALMQKSPATSYNYGLSYQQAHMLGVDCMHQWGYTGQGIVIAELDAGFYNANILPAFDSLFANNQILGCRDFVVGDTLVFEDYSHGMSVLSCMGGNLPGQLVGTSPKADFWLLRTEDIATEGLHEEINWAVAAEFADSVGADIITSSLGYSNGFTIPADEHTYADMDGNTTIITKAADWAASVGIFVVSSAGNAGGPSWYKITAPADADSVLTVGAVDSVQVIAGFSSRGPTFDGRIKPNVVAQGVHATVASDMGGLGFFNGTSFSCPITAGAVACLWQANPTLTNMQLMAAIEQSANQYASPDTIKGYGVPNFCYANSIIAGILSQTAEEEVLTAFPNPFNSTISVSFYSSSKQEAELSLFDVSGRKVIAQTKQLDNHATNTFLVSGGNELAKGIYILQLKTSTKTFYKKIVKE